MKNCLHCTQEFAPERKDQAFCSRVCSGLAKRRSVAFKCEGCGIDFTVNAYRAKLGEVKYCSKECKYLHFMKHHDSKITTICPSCGISFDSFPSQCRKTCSYTCMAKMKERKEVRDCQTCGKPFTCKRTRFDICCSWECRVERLRGENHPNWRGGELPNYGGDWVRAKRKVRKRDGNRCVRCGKTAEENGENMSVHHITAYRTFTDPFEANKTENLECLCRSCHMKIKD